EEKLTDKLGIINPVTVNSGTAALHLALVVAGIKAGDEVILPAQTFVATGVVILMQQARPVFADIQPLTGNILPQSIKDKITAKTKAIIPVHWGGYPCDLDEINAIAKERNLTVIEDAAHALGAIYKNRPIGSISEFTIFSFQAVKHLTTGDGGALCCLNQKNYQRAKILRWFGIDRVNSKESFLGEREYNISEFGYKYHLNDLGAAIGLGNLEDFSGNLKRRHDIAHRYRRELANVSGLTLLDYKDDRRSAYWCFTVLVEKRDDFVRKLRANGVPVSVIHLRIDRNSAFGGLNKDLPNQEKFDKSQVSIPIHNSLTKKDVDLIIKTIKKGW
ncbi:MAG: DegT/DnrJ/EryC1/StrS family aminotransferase, partial [Candidatus Omnitrophica bacterium]|nr:DegT/DnrJ/EryC1/StrS family aminotransferase [Candidatus Omnitrophota bacterium]